PCTVATRLGTRSARRWYWFSTWAHFVSTSWPSVTRRLYVPANEIPTIRTTMIRTARHPRPSLPIKLPPPYGGAGFYRSPQLGLGLAGADGRGPRYPSLVMPLSPGDQLGQYEIVGPLGKGGM